jgi:type VI secretion system secreted protein VgrG
MEEEGIFFYFVHEDGIDKLLIANTPDHHRPTPNKSEFVYFVQEGQGGGLDWNPIMTWNTDHQLQTGKITLWDHHFQLPTQNFNIEQPSRFDAGKNRDLEHYDFPGGYAKKYDGVDKTGGDQSSNLQNIFTDRQKTAQTEMEALDSRFAVSHGVARCSPFTAGHKFKLTNHPNKEANGNYVLTSVRHIAFQVPEYTTDDVPDIAYENTFECIPHGGGAPPFRPLVTTPKPIVFGTQTATVVGRPGDEEIFTDKYGRIKVMFHWDREGKADPTSSAWIRVAKDLAGKKWGTMYIPRVGHEVIIDFLYGDPDQPLCVGSVYNAEQMPHYDLPKFKTLTYIKTRTSPDDGKGYNELRFEDKATKEQVFIRSQLRYDLRVRGSMYETCGGSRQEVIGFKQENQPGGNLAVTVAGNYDLHVKESHFIGIDSKVNETVKADVVEDFQGKQYTQVTGKRELNAQEITLEAMSKITLKSAAHLFPSTNLA